MQIFRSLEELPAGFGPSVATVGNFDGVHLGHRAVLADVVERAKALGARSVAITFDPHPVRVLYPERHFRLITRPEQKLELLALSGIDAVLVLPFTRELSRWTAEEFARKVLSEGVRAIEVQEGENFHFGADAQANVGKLADLGRQLGFLATVHPPTLWRGLPVSSSRVRTAITEGDMRASRKLLARPFEILSAPAKGRGYGSRYTVPTINLAPYDELLPANGVYITCMQVGDEEFQSVTNVGNRPTFDGATFAVESHLLNFHPLALAEGTPLRLRFLDHIRDEMQWPSAEALKAQIGRDVARARRYFALWEAQKTGKSFQPEASS